MSEESLSLEEALCNHFLEKEGGTPLVQPPTGTTGLLLTVVDTGYNTYWVIIGQVHIFYTLKVIMRLKLLSFIRNEYYKRHSVVEFF